MKFVTKSSIPKNRKITYSNFVCDFRPLKKEKFCARMTVGGDKLDYPHDTASPIAVLIDTKLIVNSTISDHKKFGSKFCSIDIKVFFYRRKWIPQNTSEFKNDILQKVSYMNII